jgi:hypothetical protein
MRALSAGVLAAINSPVVPKIIYLVHFDFDAGWLCFNSSFNDIDYDGKTYIAAGNLGTISATEEKGGVQSAGLTVTMSGVYPAMVAALVGEPYLNRPAFIYMAVLGTDDSFNSADVRLMFAGKMDAISGTQGENPSFTVSIRSRLSDWERGRTLRYTDADQQKLYPGDRGMEYIPQLSQTNIIWPRAALLTQAK